MIMQTPQYPEIHPPSQEISDEVFQANHYVQYKEECCIEVCEEQKQKIEDTILELVEICRQKDLICMHDNVDDLIESAFNSKLISINSQRLEKEKQEVKNVVEQPAEHRPRIIESLQNVRVIRKSYTSLKNTSQISSVHAITSTKEPEHSFSMGYEHFNTTLVTDLDQVTESSTKNLVPIPRECEVTLDNGSEIDHLEEIFEPLMPIHIAEEERIKREHVEYLSRMEMLFTINPRPHPTVNANTIVESIPSSLFSIQDNESQREDIDIFTSTDELLPPVPRPPPEPSDAEMDFELDAENSVVMNDEFKCLDPRNEFD
nr:hypothetical protein [Tanacetum cinerariifolium]